MGEYSWTVTPSGLDCTSVLDPFSEPNQPFYVYCQDPSQPYSPETPVYSCDSVGVDVSVTGVPHGPHSGSVTGGSWCTSGGGAATCTATNGAPCTDSAGSSALLYGAQVGCKTTKTGIVRQATVTCSSIVTTN
jgi:hypothetical protein